MNSTSSPASEPGNPSGVNVTVHVNANPPSAPPTEPSLQHFLGYATLGLLVIGFIIGQLVTGGVVTFEFP